MAAIGTRGWHDRTPEGQRGAGRPGAFQAADDAWLWTMAALSARHEGARSTGSATPRPCEPDDVVKCLERLHQRGRISLQQLRIMCVWGERRVAPSVHHPAEHAAALLWQQAMEQLTWPLRLKGIVV